MDASIIVCTYNRSNSLKDTLHSLRQQVVHKIQLKWELIVVDNNSNDTTPEVVKNLQQDWPELSYLFEKSQGLSHARNLGIASAKGEFILFTDDDVLPESNWLETTIMGMEKYQADACGGYIAPIWETPPPSWLTDRFYGFLAIKTDRVDDYFINNLKQVPFGANMAFRKSIFQKIGLFDTNRGRKGMTLASGEDEELFERILAAELIVVFLGQSRVHHKVERFRLSKSYFRRWRFQTSSNIAQSIEISGDRRIFNIPLYLFPQLLRSIARMLWCHLTQPADEAFYREMIVCHFLGLMRGLYRL
ncbi:MAG: glycosyltransferase [Draconibacterium sp.]|nr:glycosyltransferase [Draconibacterium sp.]